MKTYIVCANLIENNGKYLLVKESKKLARNQWNFPGGQVKHHEAFVHAAKREAFEETGLKVVPSKIINVCQTFWKEHLDLLAVLFYSKISGGKVRFSREHKEVKWFTLNQIRQLHKKNLLRHRYILDSIKYYKKDKLMDLKFLFIYNRK